MKVGMKSLIGYTLGTLFIVFGATWLLWPLIHSRPHSVTDAYIGVGCMIVGALLFAPANMAAAIGALSPVVPWGRRKDDQPPPPAVPPVAGRQ